MFEALARPGRPADDPPAVRTTESNFRVGSRMIDMGKFSVIYDADCVLSWAKKTLCGISYRNQLSVTVKSLLNLPGHSSVALSDSPCTGNWPRSEGLTQPLHAISGALFRVGALCAASVA